ncbi:unnamed protein product [Phytophthora lilii]|uniref:Unnamed protein product n=1 Tax=Phytophthora lilii TaxID=2077276 RepID=A0A9W6XKD7_9STRA|nr:unnamed protein product [Phytophthora lilii]
MGMSVPRRVMGPKRARPFLSMTIATSAISSRPTSSTGMSVGEKVRLSSRLTTTALIVLKIPFQVIVYSSMFPVFCFVFALFLDSSFMDIFLNSYWAAVGDTININIVKLLNFTAAQMRNVWLLAFFVAVAMLVRTRRDYWSDGDPGIRGLVISFTSTLTIFGLYKETSYRDTNIIEVFQVGDEGQVLDIVHGSSRGLYNISTYFFRRQCNHADILH